MTRCTRCSRPLEACADAGDCADVVTAGNVLRALKPVNRAAVEVADASGYMPRIVVELPAPVFEIVGRHLCRVGAPLPDEIERGPGMVLRRMVPA